MPILHRKQPLPQGRRRENVQSAIFVDIEAWVAGHSRSGSRCRPCPSFPDNKYALMHGCYSKIISLTSALHSTASISIHERQLPGRLKKYRYSSVCESLTFWVCDGHIVNGKLLSK